MEKTKTKKNQGSDAVPNLNPVLLNEGEHNQITWSPGEGVDKYVVVSNGIRVSDKEYLNDSNVDILSEYNFWNKVVKNFPDGTKIQITKYDKKKHRIW